MKRLLRGTVEAVPADPVVPPKTLRVRLRQVEFPDDVSFVEGVPLGEPSNVRVLYDSSTPIPDASRLAHAFRKIADDIDEQVAAFVANGGRA